MKTPQRNNIVEITFRMIFPKLMYSMVKPLTANQELEYLKWQDDKHKRSTCDIVRWCARVIIVKVIFIDKLLFIVYMYVL